MAHHMALRALVLAITAMMLLLTGNYCDALSTNGEEARWLVQSSKWATLSWLEGEDKLQSLVMSVASSDEGHIFMYLMEDLTFKASLTFSEAQLDPSQFFGAKCGPNGVLDPQDPVSISQSLFIRICVLMTTSLSCVPFVYAIPDADSVAPS